MLLGETSIDDEGLEQHGLGWAYPLLRGWTTVQSSTGGPGSAGSTLPLRVAALDFLSGSYWVGVASQDFSSWEDLADPRNYALGFEPSVLEMESAIRCGLRTGPPPLRDRQMPTDVLAAIRWLLAAVPAIMGAGLDRYATAEAGRLVTGAEAMMLGPRWSASRGPCSYCHQPDSVISDEDRAFCLTSWCRTRAGERHCWRWLSTRPVGAPDSWRPEWVEVGEPDVRGRGRVTDEQLTRRFVND